jgi:DNA-binding transcriptional LysR family regulator
MVGEGFDCGVRVGDLPDSSLISVRLADNRRLCVATPRYLSRNGTPKTPLDLHQHACLTLSTDASQTRGWAFKREPTSSSEVQYMRPSGPLDCSDGQVLHAWCLADYGIAWRSIWEVQSDIAAGRLVTLLDDFAAAPNGIYVVHAQRKHMPLRLQLWVDFLKHHYGLASYWKKSS